MSTSPGPGRAGAARRSAEPPGRPSRRLPPHACHYHPHALPHMAHHGNHRPGGCDEAGPAGSVPPEDRAGLLFAAGLRRRDDDGLVAALRRRGLYARWMSWDDPRTETADLVILRATWDYAERREEFLAWSRRVRNLLNPPALVEWNSDKHYLRDLAAAGCPPSPRGSSNRRSPDPAGRRAGGQARRRCGLDRHPAVHRSFAGHRSRRVDSGPGPSRAGPVHDPRVEAGETALVFIGGKQSHAFTKGPILPPDGRAPELDDSGCLRPRILPSPIPTSRSGTSAGLLWRPAVPMSG